MPRDTCWIWVTPVVLHLKQSEDLFQLQWLGTWVLGGSAGLGGVGVVKRKSSGEGVR